MATPSRLVPSDTHLSVRGAAGARRDAGPPALRPIWPERKLTFSRVLAMPLQPVLVDARQWHAGAVTVPRTAIKPLAALVRARMPDVAGTVSDLLAGATTLDRARIAAAGALLWPAAAAALLAAALPPEGWRAAGLPEKAFADVASGVAACLALAPRLEALGDPSLSAHQLEAQLGAAVRQVEPAGWGMLLALLLGSVPRTQLLLSMLLRQNAASVVRPASAAVLAHLWDWIESASEAAPVDLGEAACGLHLRAAVLQGLATEKPWRMRAVTLQVEVRRAMLGHLAHMAGERVVMPLSRLAGQADDEAVAALEHAARGLRRLALELRGMSGGTEADAVLREAAQAVAATGVLGPVEKARLIELLDEPAAALRVLTLASA